MMTKIKFTLLLLLIILAGFFFLSGISDIFNLEYFQSRQNIVNNYQNTNPVLTGIIFTGTYILLTSLSLPVAGIMTLIGGAVFGFIWGIVLVSIASSTGATLAFMISRYLLRDAVQKKYADKLTIINEGISKDGAFYLFTLRMVPVFPYFLINAVMSITPMKTIVFFTVTLVGMLPVIGILVNAGIQLSRIESPDDIFSMRLLASLALVGIFPLLAKKALDIIKSRRSNESL